MDIARHLASFRTLAVATALTVATLAAAAPAAETTGAKAAGAAAQGPHIVLVHGAWADGSSWSSVVGRLQQRGLRVTAVQNPLTSFKDDTDAVLRTLEASPGPVVLVGHSYGGAVISEVGAHPKVKALVFVAAFAPDQGESLNTLLKDNPPPKGAINVDGSGFLTLAPGVIGKAFAQDLPADVVRVLEATQVPIFAKNFDAKVNQPAWKSKPSWYLIATQDRMIPPALQQSMSARMKAQVASVDASHVPMASRPDEVANFIASAAEAAR